MPQRIMAKLTNFAANNVKLTNDEISSKVVEFFVFLKYNW